jgi:anti-sigma factor RsiW
VTQDRPWYAAGLDGGGPQARQHAVNAVLGTDEARMDQLARRIQDKYGEGARALEVLLERSSDVFVKVVRELWPTEFRDQVAAYLADHPLSEGELRLHAALRHADRATADLHGLTLPMTDEQYEQHAHHWAMAVAQYLHPRASGAQS